MKINNRIFYSFNLTFTFITVEKNLKSRVKNDHEFHG
jgi:hypothetical protein